jgi:signal peptidase I
MGSPLPEPDAGSAVKECARHIATGVNARKGSMMRHSDVQTQQQRVSRARGAMRATRRWIRRARFVLGAVVVLLLVYAVVSYRIVTLHGGPGVLPLEGVQYGDSLLTQYFNLGRAPVRGNLVIYTDPQNPGEELLGRVVGLAGDSVGRDGPAVHVAGVRLAVGFHLAGALPEDGEVPTGKVLILTDNDDVGYRDSRDFGFVPLDHLQRRVAVNLSASFGWRRQPAEASN